MRRDNFDCRLIPGQLEEIAGGFLPERDCKELIAGHHVPLRIDRDDDGLPGGGEADLAGYLIDLQGRTLLQERHAIADKEEHAEIFRADLVPFFPDADMYAAIFPV